MNNNDKVYFETLVRGETGTMVYIVQKILNTIGYEIETDGEFSEKMESIVKEFQASKEHLIVDGIIGYKTMKEIDDSQVIS